MASRSVASSDSSARILLVDDNRNGLVARRAVLEEHGYSLTITTDPREAVRMFAEGNFDLVVTDLKMPHMDGLELSRRVRQLRPGIPVILLSGFADGLGFNEDSTGCSAVIQKSSNEVQQLVRAVNRVLKKAKTPKKPAASAGAKLPASKTKGAS